MNSDIKIRIL